MVTITPPPELGVHETAIAKEGVGAVFKRKGPIAAVRYAGFSAYEVAADVQEDGSITLQICGPPSVGEDNVLSTASRLIEFLNTNGDSWGSPIDVSHQGGRDEAGVDCISTAPDGRELWIQVSRADATAALWRALSAAGRIRGRYLPSELADIVWQAIDRKRNRSSPRTVLALDAGLLASHALDVVVEALRTTHGRELAELAFAAVYLVGPITGLVWRLAP